MLRLVIATLCALGMCAEGRRRTFADRGPFATSQDAVVAAGSEGPGDIVPAGPGNGVVAAIHGTRRSRRFARSAS